MCPLIVLYLDFMFSCLNDCRNNLYDEIKSIVNETLDEEAPEDQIKELTRTVSLILKEYTHTLINQSAISNQISLINFYQPAFTNTFNSPSPFLFPNINCSPFYQPILPSLPSQSISKRNKKPKNKNNKNKKQKNKNQNSIKFKEEPKFESPPNPPISEEEPKPTPKPPFFSTKPSQSLNQPNISNNPKPTPTSTPTLFTTPFSQDNPQTRNKSDDFSSSIYKILKQVHPDIGISTKAMMIMNSFITDIFERIATESARLVDMNDINTLGSREVQTATRLVIPGELSKQAVSEGGKAVAKFNSEDPSVELQFPVGRIHRLLREGRYGARVGAGAPVFMAAVLEHITRVVLELAGNVVRDSKLERISPRHIMAALRKDGELSQLLSYITMPQADSIPHINKVILGIVKKDKKE